MEVVIAIAVVLLFLVIKGVYDSRQTKKIIMMQIKDAWGQYPEAELTPERIDAIRTYYNATMRPGQDVDDITWNDANMDEIFEMINNTCCSIGEEYLYAVLRKLEYKNEVLEEREKLIAYFQEHTKERESVQYALRQMGKLRTMSFYKELRHIKENIERKKVHGIYCGRMAASIILLALAVLQSWPIVPFIVITIVCLADNVIKYYKRKADIENSFFILTHILKLLYGADLLLELDCEAINPYRSQLEQMVNQYSSFRKKAKFITGGNNMSGDLLDIIMDYVRMIFHMDLIMFDSMIKDLESNTDELLGIYEIIGKLDAFIAIASFRTFLKGEYCIPKLYQQAKPKLDVENMYHPFIEEPVKNSIHSNSCLLVTGSNASGKSTFIKTAAVNAILAQTIHTCTCQKYSASFFQVYSSMALTDNLLGKESYYIVEIKSLKRILDSANDRVPTLCFVDEVLRGTNTLERIAASSRILEYLARLNVLCFAATHDIELTYILEKHFQNYHFQEEVKEDQVVFDYQLRPGRATSRNAIKLLKMMNYPMEVVEKAGNEVNHFLNTGSWNNI
ncbi:MutS-related protein [[Clostridium] polysaccharolyticum]|uniref:MutS domain V n=1 Tax=[Clostridium] polysaccharolyticum TaxID=29364 RepID=A0A1I0E3A4_9FIRM|nr:hypothetical protein [[Clostridium] polysaccharolyticum]SET39571.1 MutS domain V [[Clostridium] polysaccharolyticum]